MSNIFVENTIQKLGLSSDNNRLSCGFDFNPSDSFEECVLIIGLNPAGDENNAKHEKENPNGTFFYTIGDFSGSPLVYKNYFKPIYEFANKVTDNNAKWSWCNRKFSDFEDSIKKDSVLNNHIDEIKRHYEEEKSKKYTILVGDLFYYHDTNSKKVIKLFEKAQGTDDVSELQEPCRCLLKTHIDLLKKHNKKILFVYINNTKASEWICGGTSKTFEKIDDIPVFYGPMLSGQRAVDRFSRNRLEDEIKKELNIL